jgi:hypothetical protein
VVSAALAGTAAGPGGKSAGGTGGKGKEKDKAEFAATPKKEEGKKDDSALAKVVKDRFDARKSPVMDRSY